MSIESAISAGRAAAESRMASTVTIRRKTGATTVDGDGLEVPVWADIHAALPMRLGGANTGSSGSRTYAVAGADVEVALRVAHIPATTDDIRDGDLIDVTAGENAGLVLRVVEATWQDQATARRLPVVIAERPEEWA